MAAETPTEFNVAQSAEGLITDAAKVVVDAFTTGPTSPATIADATIFIADGITFTQQEANSLLARAIAWEQKNAIPIQQALTNFLAKL
jgi:hypothetical protein